MGVGRSSAVSGTSLIGGSGKSAQTKLQEEYSRQVNSCLNGGAGKTAQVNYQARVKSLENSYQARLGQIEFKKAQLARVLAQRSAELRTQSQAAAQELMQNKADLNSPCKR
ncbi:MAG: hypothetical protein R2827_01015 [Bdellovibrionales bacterium]